MFVIFLSVLVDHEQEWMHFFPAEVVLDYEGESDHHGAFLER